jgi:Flp pilus assembly protein TadD
VGYQPCVECHAREVEAWKGSHHALAMQKADEGTVLGDFRNVRLTYNGVTSTFFRRNGMFFVRTDGPDGKLQEHQIAYTFGVAPLQQYLVAFPRGRYQALSIAWDSRPKAQGGQRWFHLYPGEKVDHRDVLHWTRPSQNWNFMCAECHSTNLRKGYRPAKNGYETTFSEITVSCEACHGPASAHVAWERERKATGEAGPVTGDRGLVVRLREAVPARWVGGSPDGIARRDRPRESQVEVETCARCHSRRGVVSEDYVHGRPILDTHRVALLEGRLYHADGQILDEVYEYGSFLQSRMYQAGVTCTDCHDPHGVGGRGDPDATCAKCHEPSRFSRKSHHFHAEGTRGASCVECHMTSRTYMVVDPRRDHSFRLPRPDLTVKIGTPNACNGCHTDRPAAWAATAVERWYGPSRRSARPHYGEALHAGRRHLAGAGAALIRLVDDASQPAIVRATGLSLLREHLSPASLPAVERALADPSPMVRQAALQILDGADPATRARLAAPLLTDQVRGVRIDAARALAEGPPNFLPPDRRAAFGAALEEWRVAQWVNADRPEGHMNLGWLHAVQGDLAGARTSYEAALRIEPGFVPAYINLADVLRAQGRDDEGEKALRKALERDPRNAQVHHSLGLLLVRQRRLPEALGALRQATELDQGEPRFAYVYGVALNSAGRRSEALAVLRQASRRHPAHRELLIALTTINRDAGDISSALAYALALVQLMPDDASAQALLRELQALQRSSPGATPGQERPARRQTP